ncbi:MAG: helix-turn-helix domain-containing protein [Candidatus Competibacteraceae bacterium]|jgi:AcrR family transcriptional regulator|nr:helix-turn-helix domain-containing protein [Candidatus Competibacteraceae bacterium]
MNTVERILSAAAVEFAERGVHGVRMEHVAKRAKLNKALVYRHFRDKENLYRETLRHELNKRKAFLATLPPSLEEMLVLWSRQQAKDAEFIRLVAQEGLHDQGGKPVEADVRKVYYAQQVDMLRGLQASGSLHTAFDPEPLFFALLMLTVGPVLLPQVMRLAIPGDDRAERWDQFLKSLVRALAPQPDEDRTDG